MAVGAFHFEMNLIELKTRHFMRKCFACPLVTGAAFRAQFGNLLPRGVTCAAGQIVMIAV